MLLGLERCTEAHAHGGDDGQADEHWGGRGARAAAVVTAHEDARGHTEEHEKGPHRHQLSQDLDVNAQGKEP